MPAGKWLDSFALGEEVPLNALTDYGTLGGLLGRYNRIIRGSHPPLILDVFVRERWLLIFSAREATKTERRDCEENVQSQAPAHAIGHIGAAWRRQA